MPTLLVTAFGPFPGAPENPTSEIVACLDRCWRTRFACAGVRLATAVLPVVYDVAPELGALLDRERPDALVHLGLASRRPRVCVETRARNGVTTIKPDASRRYAGSRALDVGGCAVRASSWNIAQLVASLRRAGVDATSSVDAGDYVCNAIYWRSLENRVAPAVFIHAPQKGRARPADVARALAAVLPGMTRRIARAGRRAKDIE